MREAQSTSELEGTFTTLDEVLAADFIEVGRQSAELREVMTTWLPQSVASR
jgi:hypothetical protein